MESNDLLVALALIALTAVAGGLAAQAARQPPIVGYLAGGVLVGPHGLGLLHEAPGLSGLADVGLILLMFALGAEVSISAVVRMGALPVVAGVLQILAMTGLWSGLALLLGWPPLEGAVFGYLLAISSTAIVLKLLSDRGDLDSIHGRILVGLLVFQDVTVVPAMVLFSALPGLPPGDAGQLAWVVATALARALALLGGMFLMGLVVVPRVLAVVAHLRSRELFALSIFALVIGTASLAVWAGVSIALGAFIAGIVVSESEYSGQALADVVPLRDIFASFFFVSLGVLTDPAFLVGNMGLIALVMVTLVVVACLTPALVTLAFGYPLRPALLVGAGILPMGEFNFVLAGAAVAAGVASEQLLSLTLAAALVSLLAAPAALTGADRLYRAWVARRPAPEPNAPGGDQAPLGPRHAVICGYGETGRTIVRLLRRRNVPVIVVDLDPHAIARARADEVPYVFGDVSRPEVLEHCQLHRARALVIAVSDPLVVDIAVQNALRAEPRLDIVARVGRTASLAIPDGARVELVEPRFEAGLEIVRHTLIRFGLTSQETQLVLTGLRQNREA